MYKVEATCTAHMAVAVDITSGAVTVSFCRYHVGHKMRRRHGDALMNVICIQEEVVTELMQLDVPVEPTGVSFQTTAPETLDRMRQQLQSECQQLIALANSCDSMEAMAYAMTHVKTANASICAAAQAHTQFTGCSEEWVRI